MHFRCVVTNLKPIYHLIAAKVYVALEFLEISAYKVHAFEVSAKLTNNFSMRSERSTATLHISGIKVFHV